MEIDEYNHLVQYRNQGIGIPKATIVYYDRSPDGVLLYMGISISGTATSAAAWYIKKYFYDTNGNPSYELASARDQVWDNRAAGTYS